MNGTVLSASDLKGSEDSKGLEAKDDKGTDGAKAPEAPKVDNKDLESRDISYREKPKYVSLEKHRKILKQRNEARKALEKSNESSQLENLGIDNSAAEKMADKLGLDPEATKEFANLIFKSGVDAAMKMTKVKYGDKIKEVSVISKNQKLTQRFEEDFTNNLISVLDNDADKKLARENKSELMKLAFLSDNLKTPLYNLFVKNIKSNNRPDTDPLEGGKTGGSKSGDARKLEDMSIEEQNALPDDEWEKLDADRIKRMKS